MTPAGLTCIACEHPLYLAVACITSDGYRHRKCPPATCQIDGCERVSSARNWCHTHYKKWQRHGDPLAGKRFEIEDVEWIVECGGVGLDEAAKRLDILPGSLAKKLRELGRADLSDALLARNPHDWNRLRTADGLPTARTPQSLAKKNAKRNEVRKAARRERVAA